MGKSVTSLFQLLQAACIPSSWLHLSKITALTLTPALLLSSYKDPAMNLGPSG